MFASLHNHTFASNIRFLDSINKPEEMVNKAIALGFSGMAFTDHESLSAAVTILKLRDTVSKTNPDFKFIFGNEIYLIDAADYGTTNKYYHFILLALDEIGWKQLKQLSSRAWDRSKTEKGILRTPTTYQDIEEIIGADQGHIFASTACLGGELPNCILNGNHERAEEFIKWCIKAFGKDRVAIELQPSDAEEQITVNHELIRLAKLYNLPPIVTTDSHYLDEEDFNIHSAFLNSRKSSDRETEKFYRFTYVMSEGKMVELLKLGGLSDDTIEEAFQNTCKIADLAQNYDFRHSTIVPRIKVPPFKLEYTMYLNGDTETYPLIKKFYESDDEQDTYLMYQMEQGFKNKHVEITPERLERINYELDILDYISNRIGQKLSAYLNLTTDIVNIAWQVSLVGCGRGSACGFFINYLIGITQADPLKYDLPAWRFLNKERVELPKLQHWAG